MEREPKRVHDFFSYFESQLISKGYDKEQVEEMFEQCRVNAAQYQKTPEGDTWYKRLLLNDIITPLLHTDNETGQNIMERLFYGDGSHNSQEES